MQVLEKEGWLKDQFLLTSDECELLLAFEACPSLPLLAEELRRDHSVIARSLKRISEKCQVVEKKAGKWVLTAMGQQINAITRSTMTAQQSVLKQRATLRIGTNREFASRILATDFASFQKFFPDTMLIINAYEHGTEEALLQNQIDIGIDCDRPYDPEIGYKLLVDEPIVAVATKAFVKKYRGEIAEGRYMKLPHFLCDRLHPDKILAKADNQLNVIAKFNDIATTRAACTSGAGWALLPSYAIQAELEAGALVKIDEKAYGKSKYGVWWLRSRSYLKESSEKVSEWLREKKL